MTDSTDKKNPPKRGGRLDADLDALLDNAQSSLASAPEPADEEDAIDRLLSKDPFDLGMEPESLFGKEGKSASDDEMSLEDRFARFGEIGDEFDITGFDDDITLDVDEFAEDPSDSLASQTQAGASKELPDTDTDAGEQPGNAVAAAEDEPEAKAEEPAEVDEFSEFDEFGDDFFDQLVADEFAEDPVPEAEPTETVDSSEIELAIQDEMETPEEADFPVMEDEFAEDSILDAMPAEAAMVEEETETDEFLPDFDISAFEGMDISDETELPGGMDALEEDSYDETGEGIVFSDDPQEGIKELLQPDAAYTAATERPQALDYDDIAEKLGIPGLSQFSNDQEAVNSKQKKAIQELEAKAKKSVTFGIAGLATGAIALVVGIVVAVLGHGTSSDVQKMSESVAAIEKQKQAEAASPPATQADLAVLEQQFNAKVNDLVQQTAGNTLTKEEIEAEPPEAANKTVTEDHRHQAADKMGDHAVMKAGEAKKDSKAHGQPETPVKSEKSKAEPVPAHTAATEKPAPAKKVEPVKTAETATKTKKTVVNQPAPVKKAPVQPTAAGSWSVNLIAIKQQWYAQSKAAEFERKGVPVEVIPVEVNNQTWYRLRVTGFKDRQEANEYSARVKKALNLSSVWVGK